MTTTKGRILAEDVAREQRALIQANVPKTDREWRELYASHGWVVCGGQCPADLLPQETPRPCVHARKTG